MNRLYIAAQAIAMAAHGVDELLTAAGLLQQLRGLDAVLLWPLLEINVVQQADNAPELRVITALLRKTAHDALNRQRMS